MENNQFEGLEEVEQKISLTPEEPELKEYEKLLVQERNRQLVAKAINLVEFGCFNQKEENGIDFTLYSRLSQKKYKGKYDVYENIKDNSLILICPLTEDDVDDNGNKKASKPYAYDCIYVESMDEETYQQVKKAAITTYSTAVDRLYKAGFISYFILLAITFITFLGYLIMNLDSSVAFFYALCNSFAASAALIAADVIALPVLVLASIKYKKFKR